MPKGIALRRKTGDRVKAMTGAGDSGQDQSEQLFELRQRLNDITRLVSDWVWETDADYKLIYLSQRVFDHLGFQPIELLGKRLDDIGTFHALTGRRIEPNWLTPFRDVSFRSSHKDGEDRFFLISALPVFNPNTGDFQGIRGTARDVTESRKKEEALRRSEERFRTLFDSFNQGILVHQGHKPLYANQALADMYGYDSVEEILSLEDARDLIVPQYRHQGRTSWFIESRQSYDKEYKGLRKDGSEFWVDKRVFLINWDGELAVCSVRVNIDERKKAEEALRKSELQFRSLIDNSTQGILIHRHYKPLYANQALADIYGYDSIEQILALKTTEVLTAAESRHESFHARIMNGTDEATNRELKAIRADGSTFWVYNRGFAIDWEGERAVCSFRVDITERKQVEDALREKEELFRGAVATLREGFVLYDQDDRIVLYNNEFLRLHPGARDVIKPGVSFEEIARESLANGVIADAVGREEEFLKERLELHHNPKGPVMRQLSDGTWYIINESRTPDGGYVSAETDITELKKAEAALRESEERHRNFAADVAHELRTPLAVMRSQLDSMKDDKAIQSLRDDIDAMSRLISQLLATARLDFLAIRPTDKADIHAICAKVAAYLAPLAVKQRRSIELVGAGEPVWVNGDADSLEQAVRNLVENAIKHTAENTTVTIKVSKDSAIAVIDKGDGIAPEDKEKIFVRFWSLDRRVGGAGLGLAIVKRTVDVHGGTISLKDAKGGGLIFTIRLKPFKG